MGQNLFPLALDEALARIARSFVLLAMIALMQRRLTEQPR